MYTDPKNQEQLYDGLNALEELTRLYRKMSAGEKQSLTVQFAKKAISDGFFGAMRSYARSFRFKALDRKLPAAAEADEIAYPKEAYFSDCRIAVYMTVFGGYDTVKEPVVCPDNIDYYLVTEGEVPAESAWIRKDPSPFLPTDAKTPASAARWCRMHPNILFPEYNYAIYLDGSTWITSDLTPLVSAPRQYPVAMFMHKNRDCVYEELRACRIKKKGRASRLRKQEAYYRELGIPEHVGLLETPVIVFETKDPLCAGLLEAWWSEYERFPGRDQPALAAALFKLGIPAEKIGTLGRDFEKCPLFVRRGHISAGEDRQNRSIGGNNRSACKEVINRSDLDARYGMICRGAITLTEAIRSKLRPDLEGHRIIKLMWHIAQYGPVRGLRIFADHTDRYLTTSDGIRQYPDEDFRHSERVAVYTALFGNYDTVRRPLMKPDNIDYYLVTEETVNDLIPPDITTLSDKSRWCKLHPHILFSEYETAVYLDASTLVTCDLNPLVTSLGDKPAALFHHKNRDCVYDEIRACLIKGKGNAEVLKKQKAYLKQLGIPEHWGLLEAPVLVLSLKNAGCIELLNTWWTEYQKFPGRDQISLCAALKRLGHAPADIGTLGESIEQCGLFIRYPHK